MTIEVTAKKVEDAIKQGAEQLGVSIDKVDVEVIDVGGFLRKAKVRVSYTPPEDPIKEAEPQKQAEPQKEQQPKKEQPKKESAPKKEQAPKKDRQPKKESAPKKEQPKKDQAPKKEQPQKEQQPEKPRNEEEFKAAEKKSVEFVKNTLQKMGFEVEVVSDGNGNISVTAPSGDDSLIIGRHGETLSALSFLAETLCRADKAHINVVVDCNGYRTRRAASLEAMAHRRADECVNKHRKIKLEPMERIDRRTVHNALTGDDRVSTASEGKEPYRYVVIIPR